MQTSRARMAGMECSRCGDKAEVKSKQSGHVADGTVSDGRSVNRRDLRQSSTVQLYYEYRALVGYNFRILPLFPDQPSVGLHGS